MQKSVGIKSYLNQFLFQNILPLIIYLTRLTHNQRPKNLLINKKKTHKKNEILISDLKSARKTLLENTYTQMRYFQK